MKTDNSTDYLLDRRDPAKDARNHKNWLLVKALWFWLTMIMFFGICVLLSLSTMPDQVTADTVLTFIISATMGFIFLVIAFFQTVIWWEDDMDGLLTPNERWRF